MENVFAVRPEDTSSDAGVQAFLFQRMLMSNAFITLALVTEVNESGEQVSVKPLVEGFTGAGERIPKTEIYGIPVWRLQRGASAVMMPPVVGDIGMIAICDRDISGVKATKQSSLPGSSRTHNYADALYLGGVLNSEPSQYVRFADDGIDVVSPLVVSVSGSEINLNASEKISANAPEIELNGNVSGGYGSNGGEAKFKNAVRSDTDFAVGDLSLIKHKHPGGSIGDGTSDDPIAG